MKLRCKNPECQSRTEGLLPLFKVKLMVDEDGGLVEDPSGVDGDYLTCCECGDSAEWVREDHG